MPGIPSPWSRRHAVGAAFIGRCLPQAGKGHVAKTVRKKSTPYPVQVAAFVSERTSRAPFSAKDVYEQIDHPGSQKSSVVGAIHKALHRLWSEDKLCSFIDANGNVMREPTHFSQGSKAVEYPQMFALPRSKAPDGFITVSYAAAALAASSEPDAIAAADPEPESEAASEPGADRSDKLDDEQGDGQTRRTMLDRLTEPAPDWLPDALMLDWVTRRLVLSRLREGLDKADEQEKRQLIMTGLQRKGELPTPDSPAARGLVRRPMRISCCSRS